MVIQTKKNILPHLLYFPCKVNRNHMSKSIFCVVASPGQLNMIYIPYSMHWRGLTVSVRNALRGTKQTCWVESVVSGIQDLLTVLPSCMFVSKVSQRVTAPKRVTAGQRVCIRSNVEEFLKPFWMVFPLKTQPMWRKLQSPKVALFSLSLRLCLNTGV